MKTLKIPNRELQTLLDNDPAEFPKYVTQILDLANQAGEYKNMAYPKRSRLRLISIDGVFYRWRFHGGELQGTLYIYGPQSGSTPLQIRSKEWFDLWLSYPFWLQKAPIIVTPARVSEIILWALANGWNPTAKGATQVLEWRDGQLMKSSHD